MEEEARRKAPQTLMPIFFVRCPLLAASLQASLYMVPSSSLLPNCTACAHSAHGKERKEITLSFLPPPACFHVAVGRLLLFLFPTSNTASAFPPRAAECTCQQKFPASASWEKYQSEKHNPRPFSFPPANLATFSEGDTFKWQIGREGGGLMRQAITRLPSLDIAFVSKRRNATSFIYFSLSFFPWSGDFTARKRKRRFFSGRRSRKELSKEAIKEGH